MKHWKRQQRLRIEATLLKSPIRFELWSGKPKCLLTPPKFRPREMWRKHFVVLQGVRAFFRGGRLPCSIRIGKSCTRLRYSKSILTNWQLALERQSRPSLNENHLWILQN